MKTSAIIEARMTSTRLPGKVLRQACGRTFLDLMIDRLEMMHSIDSVIVATTTNREDDEIVDVATARKIDVFRGSENDVLDRVLKAAQQYNVDVIVETTADCPLIDPKESDLVVEKFRNESVDYCSNILKRSYPRGMDTQVFTTNTLADVASRTNHPTDHEHPSIYIYSHPELYSLANIEAPNHLFDPDLRLTVDTPEDFELIRNIFEHFLPNGNEFFLSDILNFLNANPHLKELNSHVEQKIPKF